MAKDWTSLLRPGPRRVLDAMLHGASTLTEIADATGLRKPSLHPHLKELAALGVVEQQRIATPTGWEVRYALRDASLHLSIHGAERVALSWGSIGPWEPDVALVAQVPQPDVRAELATFLRALRRAVGAPADDLAIVLFGSAARGDATWKSDIDLFILVDRPTPALDAAIELATFEAGTASQHAFQPVIMTRAEWSESRKRIAEDAREEGLLVWAPRRENAPWSTLKRYRSISL